jgi:hypothetical protein
MMVILFFFDTVLYRSNLRRLVPVMLPTWPRLVTFILST